MPKMLKRSIFLVLILLIAMSFTACASLDNGVNADSLNGNPLTEEKFSSPSNTIVPPPQNDEGDEPGFYTATFVTNGGSPVEPMETLVVQTAPVTAFSGYIFAGWFTAADFSSPQAEFPFHLTGDTVFYAKWVLSGVKEIRTVQDLKDVQNAMSSSYILMTDLNLAGIDWMPLGMKIKRSTKEGKEGKVVLDGAIVPFTGTFDGNGHTIYNLNLVPIGQEEEYNYLPYGLFSIISNGARILNLNLSTFRITLDGGFSDFYIASLVGQMKGGLVRNCNVNGILNNPKLEYEETIWDDFFGSYAEPTENSFLGGMIGGILDGDVENCSAEGTIVSESVADGVFVGGIAGFNWDGTVQSCRSLMNIKGRYAGSLVGYNNGNIYDSYARGAATGSLSYPAVAGGLVAYNDINGKIERCYSTGAVSARTAGGLVGVNMFNYSKNSPLNIAGDPIIQALGTTGEEIYIGEGGIIRNCYSTSNVAANEYGGGLIGRAESIMPVKGREDIKPGVTNDFYFISHNFAFGDVTVIAQELAYENDEGVMVITTGVYHSVYAGGLIGHASEIRINSCLAFGNVIAESKRPIKTGDNFVYNSVYANNAIGQSIVLVDQSGSNYYVMTSRGVYGAVDQIVKRNGNIHTDFNSAEALPYSGNNGRNVNNVTFLTDRQDYGAGLGFSASIWNFNNMKIEDGRLPSLK